MEHEFGTGLRAHMGRRNEPQTPPPTPLEVEPARRTRADLDARIDSLAAAEAELIAREIEDHLEYPGQIKVTVIRESRAVEFAK